MDPVSSTTFIKTPPLVTDFQEKFLYTREVLSSRIFLGCYLERRYVAALNEYRDVVAIDAEETELHNDLNKIRKKWLNATNIKWVGITGPNEVTSLNAYCFWVKLIDITFGHYWFQIKHVKAVEQEIILHLKCIRKSRAPQCSVSLNTSKAATSEEKSVPKSEDVSSTLVPEKTELVSYDIKKTLKNLQIACKEALQSIEPHITWNNFVTVIKVGCACIIFIVMGIISLLGHLGEFVLRFLREVTHLVQAFTPILVQLIDFLSKIIGGFFILMARIFIKNQHHTVNDYPYRKIILPSTKYSRKPEYVPVTYPCDWRERNRLLKQDLLSQ